MTNSLKIFLDGTKNEKEFCSLQRTDLYTLREYLEAFKIMDNKFIYLTEEDVEFLKFDIRWLDRVYFDGLQNPKTGDFSISTIYLKAKDGVGLIVGYNAVTGKYQDICYKKIPKIYRISPSTRIRIHRQEEIFEPRIQNHLKEIEHAGKYIYDGCLNSINTAGGLFNINYAPDLGMVVRANVPGNDVIATYYHENPRYKDKPYLNKKASEELLDKLRIKPENMPNVDRTVVIPMSVFPNMETQDIAYDAINKQNDVKTLRLEEREKKND